MKFEIEVKFILGLGIYMESVDIGKDTQAVRILLPFVSITID